MKFYEEKNDTYSDRQQRFQIDNLMFKYLKLSCSDFERINIVTYMQDQGYPKPMFLVDFECVCPSCNYIRLEREEQIQINNLNKALGGNYNNEFQLDNNFIRKANLL
ncbi:hypothetical protein ABPG74_022445 [Tetrahymena malaccensis]